MAFADEEAKWEKLGSSDPLWAVLSHDGREEGGWDLGEFFSIGERDVNDVLALVDLVSSVDDRRHALDFGCGVGRLSNTLARHYRHVDGTDVSASMVEKAREYVGSVHANCAFHTNKSTTLAFPSQHFDLVVSLIVLQHMPPRRALAYVTEFIRLLTPDGLAVFQVPANSRGSSQSTSTPKRILANSLPRRARDEFYRRSRRSSSERDLDMWSIAPWRVERTVRRAGGAVLARVDDDAAGPNWRSIRYVVGRS